jgi:hypothetical protein
MLIILFIFKVEFGRPEVRGFAPEMWGPVLLLQVYGAIGLFPSSREYVLTYSCGQSDNSVSSGFIIY